MRKARMLPVLIQLAGAVSCCGGSGSQEDRGEAGVDADSSEARSADLVPLDLASLDTPGSDSQGAPVLDATSDATTTPATCGLHDGRRFPVGSVFSDGCGCCICDASGGNCYGGNFCTRFVDGGIESFMSLPPCQSDDGCTLMIGAGAVCVFDPGCSSGQGRCVSNPLATCSAYTGDIAHDYCGCDGLTFQVGVAGAKTFPDRPYAHLGACP